jgi:hypothetical protein
MLVTTTPDLASLLATSPDPARPLICGDRIGMPPRQAKTALRLRDTSLVDSLRGSGKNDKDSWARRRERGRLWCLALVLFRWPPYAIGRRTLGPSYILRMTLGSRVADGI